MGDFETIVAALLFIGTFGLVSNVITYRIAYRNGWKAAALLKARRSPGLPERTMKTPA